MAFRLSPHLTVMANAAQKAAKRLLRDFSEVEQLQVSVKGPSDFVSQADIRAEQTLKEELNKARPGYSFLMEESGASGSDNWTWRWVVDPLDGTTNFLHGMPHWAISIALERRLPDGTSEIYFHPATQRDATLRRLMPDYEHAAELQRNGDGQHLSAIERSDVGHDSDMDEALHHLALVRGNESDHLPQKPQRFLVRPSPVLQRGKQ